MWSNEGNRTRQNDDESSGEDKAAATHYPVKLLMRSHHKSRLISMRNEMNNRQCWFAPVTIRKGATTVTTSATSQHHDERIITQCIIPVEFIENGMSRNNNDNGDNNGIRNKPIHCLVLATKANDAIAALESVWDTRLSSSQSSSSSHSSPSPTKIIILSNGALAIRDAIYNRFGRRLDYSQQDRLILDDVHLILGTTTHGAHKTSPRSTSSGSGNYDITHAGIGCTACTDMQFTQLCRSIGWDAECLSMLDMHVMLWKKLAVNCVINPLTAIHNVTNGQLLSLDTNHHVEDIITTTRQILDEVSLVARMEMRSLYEETMSNSSEDGGGGYDENNNNIPPRNQWLLSTTETLSSSSLEKFVYQVMDSTKDNISSMLQDVRSGKATEVRFLNGYVASLGQEKYGMDCSRNLEMCRLVEELYGINPR